MLYQELFLNRFTGEILAASDAIRDYYSNHKALDDWRDEWEKIPGEYSDKPVQAPNFAGAVQI